MAPLALAPLVLATPLRDDDLLKAISLLCSPVFGALSMANALGGGVTDAWRAVREHPLSRLVDEAIDRGLDLTSLKASCCDVLVLDTPPLAGAFMSASALLITSNRSSADSLLTSSGEYFSSTYW